ncbi:LURP-one-related/scramblase family protein [Romboutsia lituseburensis]|uniref:LURP-one-related/scramblase family protein n=1 Tax=Romboutsia lituseburensis TaxID=1537 RepID=UPI001475EAB5|nr:LURP-one-related family protein [Romboutsia lituseburensis]
MKSKFFKLKEDFWIKNDQKEKVYFVDNKFLTMGLQFDISKGNEILYYVKEKLLTFMSKYEIFEQDKVIAKVKQKVTIFREKIEVESKYGNLEIVGSIFDYNYRIYQNKKK